MYSHGYDGNAESLLKDIPKDEHMGRLLLEIAGRRLNLYTNFSQKRFLTVASVGQQLLQYLDNLVSLFDFILTYSKDENKMSKMTSAISDNTFFFILNRKQCRRKTL